MSVLGIKSLKSNIGVNTLSTQNKVNTLTTSTSDINIYNIQQNQLDINNYMYDGTTIMHINSTSNSNLNYSNGQYFDPSSQSTNYNYAYGNPNNLSNQSKAYSSLLTNTNAQNLNQSGSLYSLDITNGIQSTPTTNPLFFSLTSEPYTNTSSSFNTIPNYSTTSPSSSFIYQSQYSFTSTDQLLIVKLIFTINNTKTLNTGDTSSGSPSINVNVLNQVFTKENIQKNEVGKVYSNTSILRFTDNPQNFNSTESTQFLYNNIPLVFAPNFEKEFITIPILYIPPIINSGSYYGQYLPSTGYSFINGIMSFDTNSLIETNEQTNFGHFICGVAYQNDTSYSSYLIGGITAEITVKNIWNSPLTIYKNYLNYSVIDMELINVILLVGNNINGGQYLVINSGTPISTITKYGITPLSNFMNIMNSFMNEDNSNTPLIDYFMSVYQIKKLNNIGYNVNIVVFDSIYDTNVIYNPSNYLLSGSSYIFLHMPNSANMSFNPYNQNIINKNIKKSYFGLENTVLCSLGNLNYTTIELNMVTTSNNNSFGNALYLGIVTISNKNYYALITLPESGFVPNYSIASSSITVYATDNALSYIMNSTNSATQFIPNSIEISNTTNKYKLSNVVLTVSNEAIL